MWHQESERYALRLPVKSDRDFMFTLLSNPAVVEHHPMTPLKTPTEAEKTLEDMKTCFESRTALFWIIYDKSLQEPVGRFGLQNINWQNNSAQLLVDVLPNCWGEGLLYEVGVMAMNFGYGELGLHRIEALIQTSHPFMDRYVEAIGFTKEGKLPALMQHNGQWIDFSIYSLLATDKAWENAKKLGAFSLTP